LIIAFPFTVRSVPAFKEKELPEFIIRLAITTPFVFTLTVLLIITSSVLTGTLPRFQIVLVVQLPEEIVDIVVEYEFIEKRDIIKIMMKENTMFDIEFLKLELRVVFITITFDLMLIKNLKFPDFPKSAFY